MKPLGRGAAALSAASPAMRPGTFDFGGDATHMNHHSRILVDYPLSVRGFRLLLSLYRIFDILVTMKCVAPGLVSDPRDCWLQEDCRYWSYVLQRCCYEERRQAEQEHAREEGRQTEKIKAANREKCNAS